MVSSRRSYDSFRYTPRDHRWTNYRRDIVGRLRTSKELPLVETESPDGPDLMVRLVEASPSIPNLINQGTEAKIARLAKNLDNIKLKLGFFLLKNPSPSETDLDAAEQSHREIQFFTTTAWQSQDLDMERVGGSNLRHFLQKLLEQHIEMEMPKVQTEVEQLLVATETRLQNLGEERQTIHQIRSFFTHMSMRFHGLTQAELYGNYQGPDNEFFSKHENRLRAVIHKINEDFAASMRTSGMKRRVEDSDPVRIVKSQSSKETESKVMLVTQAAMEQWVKKTYLTTRGLELPGNYNHVLLSELFHEQSSRWSAIATQHVAKVWDEVARWVHEALLLVVVEEDVRQHVSIICRRELDDALREARKELDKLLADEKRQPITYNHYYTDNIQKARNDANHQSIEVALVNTVAMDFNGKLHISNHQNDLDKLRRSLQTHINVNMTEQACAEAEAALTAYYKVALKTFVDNVCRQSIERHLSDQLLGLFAPTSVAQLSDDDLLRIGFESESRRAERALLNQRAQGLRQRLADLQSGPIS